MFKGKLLLEKMLESVEVVTATRCLRKEVARKAGGAHARYVWRVDLVLSNTHNSTLQMFGRHHLNGRSHGLTYLTNRHNSTCINYTADLLIAKEAVGPYPGKKNDPIE